MKTLNRRTKLHSMCVCVFYKIKSKCTYPLIQWNSPEGAQLTSASPSPLQECQNTILFLLPQKTKVTSSGQTLDSCTFRILLWLFGCKVLLSPKRTCFIVRVIVRKRTKKKSVLFNKGFCCRGLTYFRTVKQSARTFYWEARNLLNS